ncbi:MAG: 4-(cytidine 5'-diphospho)-2-C-methyl-D-erythritol kinase [Cyclobacteriaceae bacterium]|jgi:4-diphosphocytidyl-2-C-methyl-D-erythritol kinase|nr:4-(cytidine 5'-diphospho)-2-C-methyl-D-erythritol kinase [Cyclobacteriaceae bacterium]
MIAFPPCKINLGLHVLRKRPDGYHDLDTVFYPVPWTDVLEIIRADHFAFTASGEAIPGAERDNLCVRAYQLLSEDYDLPPVHIHLHKIIPTGAGLGGGSSDAAHTLRLLNRLFALTLSDVQLQRYAAALGSDCAFFIGDSPQRGQGRGEVLTPTDSVLKGKYLVLVKPAIHVSTAEAYRGVKPTEARPSVAEVLAQPLARWRETLVNDFERSVFETHPAIAALKQQMYDAGAVYAAMSGSGASVFGVFDEMPRAARYDPEARVWTGKV